MIALPRRRTLRHAAPIALACVVTLACEGDTPGPDPSDFTAACRTMAATSTWVQTFADGQVISGSNACTHDAATNDVVCQGAHVDSVFGAGTITQTTRFASRGDIVDEAATNPPLSRSLGTTTVTSSGGVSLTTVATQSYDAQRRLVSTTIDNPAPLGQQTLAYTAWDSAGRPTTGTFSSIAGAFPVSITYNNTARTVTRNTGLNICTVTHDTNGIMVRESCTGTTASTTEITILTTQQICR